MKTIAELASESGVHRTTLNHWVWRIRKSNPNPTFIRNSGSIILIDEESPEFRQWLAETRKGRPRESSRTSPE